MVDVRYIFSSGFSNAARILIGFVDGKFQFGSKKFPTIVSNATAKIRAKTLVE